MDSKINVFKKYKKPIEILIALGMLGVIGCLIIGINEKNTQLLLAALANFLLLLLLSYNIYKVNRD